MDFSVDKIPARITVFQRHLLSLPNRMSHMSSSSHGSSE